MTSAKGYVYYSQQIRAVGGTRQGLTCFKFRILRGPLQRRIEQRTRGKEERRAAGGGRGCVCKRSAQAQRAVGARFQTSPSGGG